MVPVNVPNCCLELLSTVHWIAKEDRRCESGGIAEAVWAWSHRKRRFTREQIDLALGRLRDLDWLALTPA